MISQAHLYLTGFVAILAINYTRATNELTNLHGQVYSKDGPLVPPNKTLEHLRRLSESCRDQGSNDICNEQDLKDILDASQVSVDKCNEEDLKRYKDLMESHAEYMSTIVPYLKHWRSAQQQLCERTIASSFDEDLMKLTLIQRNDMDLLKWNILNQNNGIDVVDSKSNSLNSAYTVGIADYLKEKAKLADKKAPQDFTGRFSKMVEQLCVAVVDAFSYRLELYKNRQFPHQFKISNWMASVEICKNIGVNIDNIRDQVAQAEANYKGQAITSRLLSYLKVK